VNRIEKISTLVGDVALPLIGYFFWNWNLYFILLFFMLDQLARVVFMNWRMKLTIIPTKEKRIRILQGSFLFLAEILVIHAMVHLQQPHMHFDVEFWRFFTFKDMGIQQGYVLLPLIFLGEWMRINNELKLNIVGAKQVYILDKARKNSFIRIGFFALLIGILPFVIVPEGIMVFLFLTLITALVFVG
jgi:hypothetical protein